MGDDLHKRFEAILSQDGEAAGVDEGVALRSPVASMTLQKGTVTSRLIEPSGDVRKDKGCVGASLMEFAGIAQTESNGLAKLALLDYEGCDLLGRCFPVHPVCFVATPLSRSPVLLTVKHSIVAVGPGQYPELVIEVLSWDLSGAPAPDISFNWWCRINVDCTDY